MVGACHVNAWTGQFYGSVPDIDIVKEVIFDAIFQTLWADKNHLKEVIFDTILFLFFVYWNLVNWLLSSAM